MHLKTNIYDYSKYRHKVNTREFSSELLYQCYVNRINTNTIFADKIYKYVTLYPINKMSNN